VYEREAAAGAVVHTHSLAATVLSRAVAPETWLELRGYELAKAFAGVADHEACVGLPIIENDADARVLARRVRAAIEARGSARAYLIRGHGSYTWGRDMDEALRHAEALEFLLACALEERRLRR
jgi:methylthioribulose-1-phosphate dehydratase